MSNLKLYTLSSDWRLQSYVTNLTTV